jgi:hypothetical protein
VTVANRRRNVSLWLHRPHPSVHARDATAPRPFKDTDIYYDAVDGLWRRIAPFRSDFRTLCRQDTKQEDSFTSISRSMRIGHHSCRLRADRYAHITDLQFSD